jgi:hypothetical protein
MKYHRSRVIGMRNQSSIPDPEYIIRVLIVDDLPETQESVKRALTFETAFEVVGIASSGLEGVDAE